MLIYNFLFINNLKEIPELQNFFHSFLSFIFSFITSTILLLIAKKVIDKLLNENSSNILNRKYKIHKPAKSKTISSLIHNLFIYIVYFIYFYYLLTILGIPIGTLLAGAGIFGIAIGLGAKDFITDIINGFFIIFEDKFEVDDFISLPNHNISGTVTKLNLRSTLIKSTTGEIFIVPNGDISIVNNMSRSSREIQIELPYTLDIPIETYDKIIKETTQIITKKYSDILVGTPRMIGIIKGNNHLLYYRITLPVSNNAYYQMTSQFYYEYINALQASKIKLPTYSTQVMNN